MLRLYHEYTRDDCPMTNPIDYVTVIEPVYEVTLFGTAELAPWQHLLQDESLPIAPIDGRAALLLSVIDSKYMGVRFQEFSISVSVGQDRYFFPHALLSGQHPRRSAPYHAESRQNHRLRGHLTGLRDQGEQRR